MRDMLAAHGWSVTDLANITGFNRSHLSGMLTGKISVSPVLSVALSAAFGNEASEWLRWSADYQLSLLEPESAMTVERRARLYKLAPVRDMEKRDWIKGTKTPEGLESELTKFFGRPLSEEIAFPVAMLKSDPLSGLSIAERAWCFRARHLAEALTFVAEFDRSRMNSAEKKLRQLAAYPKETERLSEMLAYYGIRFVVIEPLPGTKIDGAAFWIDDSPVIAVSARWDRIDAFWFTVMHEFMHIKNMDAYSVDVNLVIDSENGITIAVSDNASEERANTQAANALVPTDELQSFIARTSPYYASTRIIQFANMIKMHPGVIVGQLQFRGELRYSSHRDFLVKVRKYVVDTAVTDGWGRSLSPSTF